MAKENLSQRVLLEILTKEIETLRKTSSNINQVGPLINEKLSEIKNTSLEAHLNREDLQRLENILSKYSNEMERRLKKHIMLPKWLVYWMIFISVSFISLFSYFFYLNFK